MTFSREEIVEVMKEWNLAWKNHDLEGVMKLFHEDVFFENWTGGKAMGKEALRAAWTPWFADHGGFQFTEEDFFVDERDQKVLYRWQLDWPSAEKGQEGKPEKRRGLDVIHFQEGKIIKKLTYSKTTVEIDGQRFLLHV
jgi:ketosteroid isomerase-like protein